MPWEFIGQYIATKLLDNVVDEVLFNEKIRNQLTRKGIAERYLKLTADQLLSFYQKETPLEISLAGRRYILPMSVTIDSTGLEESKLYCQVEQKTFNVSEQYISYIKPIIDVLKRDKKSFDGRVTRLSVCQGNMISLQEASYFEGVATNFGMDHKPKERKDTLRDLLHRMTRSFGSFEGNPLVNHVGVVCMLETIDGILITQKRSRKVTNRGGTLSSSVSGAVNWTDIRKQQSPFPIDVLAESTFREANEELGVEINSMCFLGLLREYLRGGKPELYFFARTKEPFDRLKVKWLQAEHKDESTGIEGHEFHSDQVGLDELSRDRFKVRVRRIMDKIGEDANLTLTAGVALAARHILQKSSNRVARGLNPPSPTTPSMRVRTKRFTEPIEL